MKILLAIALLTGSLIVDASKKPCCFYTLHGVVCHMEREGAEPPRRMCKDEA